MKIAVAIASENALPSAFVVFRGLENSIRKASQMGYDGIELALLDKSQIDVNKIIELIDKYNLRIINLSEIKDTQYENLEKINVPILTKLFYFLGH